MRLSKKGVPHTIYAYKDHLFSVCYFGKGKMYRIFEYNPGGEQKKLLDVGLDKGGVINLQFVLDGLIEKFYAKSADSF